MTEAAEFDALVERFEAAWRRGAPTKIGEFVERELGGVEEAPPALLWELIAVDLEWSWRRARRGAGRRVEEYLQELGMWDRLEPTPLEVVLEEYRARRQWGDGPTHDEFLKRFAFLGGDLRRGLTAVDAEIRVELGDRGRAATSGGRASIAEKRHLEVRGAGSAAWNGDWARFEDYVLHEMIGAGMSGRVYRATHLATGRPAAVKFLRKAFQADELIVEHFLAEARMASLLAPAGAIPVQEVGRTSAGGYFLVMELMAGPDLGRVIASGPVAISDAVRWGRQAATTIAAAHEQGIVHCDVKPGNLVLDGKGKVRVTDFGLARSVDELGVGGTRRIAGTAPFMAPEQVSSWWGAIGPATDVYGLGAVLYALLGGEAPHWGESTADILARVASGAEPTAIELRRPEAPPRLAAIVARALSKSPLDRFASAKEMAEELKL